MVGAHPCLMWSQEEDLDNRSYQRRTVLSVCFCVCAQLSVLIWILFHSWTLGNLNELQHALSDGLT